MQLQKMSIHASSHDDDEAAGPLPGFRFHPTDQELVTFYLRRKVQKRPIALELIKQIDIYKHNPWDLPGCGTISSEGENEACYYYCKRARKYKNSARPNRVTASGFWKATGIDRAVHSHGGGGSDCIGLKKTLVFYRGSAGRATKTEWMMHEFRFPPTTNSTKNTALDAEIWTLCRIFKRNNVSSTRNTQINWRGIPATTTKSCSNSTPYTSAAESDDDRDKYLKGSYINFSSPDNNNYEKKPDANNNQIIDGCNHDQVDAQSPLLSVASPSSFSVNDVEDEIDQILSYDESFWDEVRSVMEFALHPSSDS